MRILFLTQYFPPETGAAQNRLSDLARRLTQAGHRVTVLTALPSYPQGEVHQAYRGRFMMMEDDAGIRIVRTWAHATRRKSFVPRLLNYLSFAMLSVIVGWLTAENADIVFVESPPLFLGFSGYLLSKLKHAKFVLNISDLWPESAVALGVLRSKYLIRLAIWAEEWLYHRARLVTGQTQGIIDSIQRRCSHTRIQLVTNGVSPEFIAAAAKALESRETVRLEFGVKGKFVVGYAGLHGLVYRLDAILEAARALTNFHEIHFLLIGDGPEKNRLQERARYERLTNTSFFPTLPAARMPEVFTSMDVTLIIVRRHDLFKGTLPSKLFEAMGAGVPVIGAVEGEAQTVIQQANCGICVKSDDPLAIAEAILTLFRDPALRRRLGKNGREYVSTHYNRREIAKRFESLLVASQSVASFLPEAVRATSSIPQSHNEAAASLSRVVQPRAED